jgi:hypothetical protein
MCRNRQLTSWPDYSLAGNQKRFWCDPVYASGAEQSGSPDAHRGDGKHFIVQADEKLTAFLELGSEIRAYGEFT